MIINKDKLPILVIPYPSTDYKAYKKEYFRVYGFRGEVKKHIEISNKVVFQTTYYNDGYFIPTDIEL